MTKDQQYLIDSLISHLHVRIMTKMNLSFLDAQDLLYHSETYDLINDVETGLYLQSACYNYELLEQEIKFGKIA